jgi:threonine dehydrogenase-like Zn-dependent dehydrogenase
VKALLKTPTGAAWETVREPKIEQATDILVRITYSALSWSDLLLLVEPEAMPPVGSILGHQAIGVVVEAGSAVTTLAVGDRVVISPIVACGTCAYCKVGFYAQCVRVNPEGRGAGGIFLGGWHSPAIGDLNGVHAQYARIPFADVGCWALPASLSDLQGLLLSELLPLGYFGAKLARICAGDRVAVFGADPAGIMAAATSLMIGAGRVLVVDSSPARLANLEHLGVETVAVAPEAAGEIIRDLTEGHGVQCAIVTTGAGIDYANQEDASAVEAPYSARLLHSAVNALSRDSTLAIVGVYPRNYHSFALGDATARYVTIKAAACNYSKYLLPLTNLFQAGLLNTPPFSEPAPLAEYAPPAEAYPTMRASRLGWVVLDWSTL